MSRSGCPPLAGGSAVADEKNISKLSRRVLASRRAADPQNCWLIWLVKGLVVPLLMPLVLH